MIAAVCAELWVILEKYRRFTEKVLPELSERLHQQFQEFPHSSALFESWCKIPALIGAVSELFSRSALFKTKILRCDDANHRRNFLNQRRLALKVSETSSSEQGGVSKNVLGASVVLFSQCLGVSLEPSGIKNQNPSYHLKQSFFFIWERKLVTFTLVFEQYSHIKTHEGNTCLLNPEAWHDSRKFGKE